MYRTGPRGTTWTIDGRVYPIGDTPGFRVLAGPWARTDHQVLFEGRPVAGADPERFVVLGVRHGADGARVFWQTRAIPGADPATFRSLGLDHGADAHATYDCVTPVDPSTFRPPNDPPTIEPSADRDDPIHALIETIVEDTGADSDALWDAVDPHDEVPELRPTLLYTAATLLLHDPPRAEHYLARAIAAGLFQLTNVTRSEAIERFGAASVARADEARSSRR